MTIQDKTRDEILQYDIKRETAKILALSSDKIDRHEYLTGEEILPTNQSQMIEQVKFILTFSTNDSVKLLQQLKPAFKKSSNWNKYQSKAPILIKVFLE